MSSLNILLLFALAITVGNISNSLQCEKDVYQLINEQQTVVGSVKILNSSANIFFTYELLDNKYKIHSAFADISPANDKAQLLILNSKISELNSNEAETVPDFYGTSKDGNPIVLPFDKYNLSIGDNFFAHTMVFMTDAEGNEMTATILDKNKQFDDQTDAVLSCLGEASVRTLNSKRVSRP